MFLLSVHQTQIRKESLSSCPLVLPASIQSIVPVSVLVKMLPKILIIGGTGAQGSAIVHALSKTGKYDLHVLTRNLKSAAAQELQEVGHITLIEGDSSNAADLRRAFQGIYACYVNTNGFALGEKDELWWGIKTFELAAEAGVKHYVCAGLPYVFKRSGYNPKYNVGHLDGKGRVVGETYFSAWLAAC